MQDEPPVILSPPTQWAQLELHLNVVNLVINNGDGATTNVAGPGSHQANSTVSQDQVVAPGFEAIAQALTEALTRLPTIGLQEEERQDVEEAAQDVLTTLSEPQQDPRKLRRALAALKGFLHPIAQGASTGAADGAQEWAQELVRQLGSCM